MPYRVYLPKVYTAAGKSQVHVLETRMKLNFYVRFNLQKFRLEIFLHYSLLARAEDSNVRSDLGFVS